jgi:hypothetical protein
VNTQRRVSAAGVALMLGGAGILIAASPAEAAEISYATECVPPPISGQPPVQGTTKVDIQAPETAQVGDEIQVVWKTVEAASSNPDIIDLEENTVKPTGKITVAGAQSGELNVEGPRENPPIPKSSPMVLSDMKGTLKLEKPGEVTLAPGFYNINVSKPVPTDTPCSPTEEVKPAVTIKVTEAGGGTAGGGTSGGGTSGGDSTSGGSASGGGDATGTSSGGGDTGGGGDPDGTEYTGKEVQVPYECKTPIGDKEATSPVQINAKKNGGNFDLTVKFKKSVMDSPADIPEDSIKPSMEVVLGRADKGTVHVEGPTNKEPIKSGEPIEIPDLKGPYKPGASGRVTLSPGVLTIKAVGTTTTCTPAKDPGVSLELDTTEQPGGASGGSSTGGTAGGTAGGSPSSGGGLAETGASDNGALRALGLLAGTAVLLGGAVFTFTPWRRLRGTR